MLEHGRKRNSFACAGVGKHDVIYGGISSQIFFPHAKLSSVVVVSTVSPFEEQNTEQEVVTRAHNIQIRRTPA